MITLYFKLFLHFLKDFLVIQVSAVPLLRRLVTGLPLRRYGFAPGAVHVGFVVDKWERFFTEFFGFPLSVSFHRDFIFIYHHVGEEQ
jgi:hypothetical protein